jgi:hypothetical protein
MRKPPNDLSGLFRSLGPGVAGTQASPVAAAQAAEQKWPLLKTIPPKRSAPTPALSDEEKSRWTAQQPVGRAERKPALSMPGLGDKLTRSLGQMGARFAGVQARPVPSLAYEMPVQTQPVAEPVRTGFLIQHLEQPVLRSVAPAPEAALESHGDDSLVNIFGRLARIEEPEAPVAPRKSSFLSRIGRK